MIRGVIRELVRVDGWLAGLLVGSLVGLLAACTSNHRVSPFSSVDPAEFLRPQDDLADALSRAQEDAKSDGLREVLRIEGTLRDGRTFLALGFEGVDPLGRAIHATRVITPAGIELALGPDRGIQREMSRPVRLLSALGANGSFPSGKDLTGDGVPDVAIAAEDGTLAVYRVDLLGSLRYPVQLDIAPDRLVDLNEDGLPDLAGAPRPPTGDPIAPELVDVAVCVGTGFTSRHPAVIAFHAAKSRESSETKLPDGASAERQLRAAIERAFHAMRSGTRPAEAFEPAAALAIRLAPLAPATAVSWVRWRGWLADHASLVGPVGPVSSVSSTRPSSSIPAGNVASAPVRSTASARGNADASSVTPPRTLTPPGSPSSAISPLPGERGSMGEGSTAVLPAIVPGTSVISAAPLR